MNIKLEWLLVGILAIIIIIMITKIIMKKEKFYNLELKKLEKTIWILMLFTFLLAVMYVISLETIIMACAIEGAILLAFVTMFRNQIKKHQEHQVN